MKKNNQLPFLIFVVSIFLLMVSPALLSHGIFFDGLIYACIARNLSFGIGDFWHLHYMNFTQPDFYGLLPLAMYIESFVFHLFPHTYLLEKLYSFSTFIITAFLMYVLWRKVAPQNKKMFWVVLLFWISVPLNMWAAVNNILENSMMIFILLSIFIYYQSVQTTNFNKKYRLILVFFSGISIYAAFLCKGVTGFFPLVMPILYYICTKKIKFSTCIIDAIILSAAAILPIVYLYFFHEDGGFFLRTYYQTQIVNSLKNIQTVDSRFYIMGRLFFEFIPAFIIMIILQVLFYFKKIKQKFDNEEVRKIIFFVSLGLAAVLPIMVSMKQSGFYILASFPLFAIAFALGFTPALKQLTDRIQIHSKAHKRILISSIILFCIAVGVLLSQYKKVFREKDRLPDILLIAPHIELNSTICLSPQYSQDWSAIAYFNRFIFQSPINFDTTKTSTYCILSKGEVLPSVMKEYTRLPLSLSYYEIYSQSPPKD